MNTNNDNEKKERPDSIRKSVKRYVAPSGKVTISGRDEALENIKAYYEDDHGSVILPPHQEEIRERWETIHGLILKGNSITAIINKVAAIFGVSKSTIRRDIQNVEEIFGSQSLSFSMRRQRASDIALKILKKAEKRKDLNNMNKALSNLIKADGLEKEPIDLPKIESHIYVIMPDPTTEALLRKAFPIQDGHINLNDLTQNTEDIEHEDLSDTTTDT